MGFFVARKSYRNSLNLFIHNVCLTGIEVNSMGSRQNLRVDCYSSCVLNYASNDYHAKLVNISLGGALISVEDDVLCKLHVGDRCDLILGDKPELCSAKYACKVISQNSSNIGINFQGIT